MKNANLATIDRDELVDIRDVKVNTSLPKRERAIDFIRQIGNIYYYKHGDCQDYVKKYASILTICRKYDIILLDICENRT